jgi:FkbM family methyltransferase
MNNLNLDYQEINKWFANKGDDTHILDHNLNENSVVMDLGGFVGIFGEKILKNFDSNLYIIEPLPQFFQVMKSKFHDNPKVNLLCVGVAQEDKDGIIYLNHDGSSSNVTNGNPINVKFKRIESILKEFGLDYVDLLQINIEGDEYPLLENMLETGIINKFKTIQVQFHLGMPNVVERRNRIQQGFIENGYTQKYNYNFVWEAWTKNS